MLLARWIVAGLVVSSAGAAGAASQDPTDAIVRAAYCVGVLNESLKRTGHRAAEATQPTEAMELPEMLSRDLEVRGKRYARYMTLMALGMCPNQIAATMALIAKGERDVADKQLEPINPGVSRCLASYRSSFAALVECVASVDPVEADILRCKSAPDGQPF